MKLFQKIQPQLELGIRVFVWAMLSAYGSGKILGGQFHRYGNLPDEVAQTPIADVGSFDLAWTFFGYSEGYIWFIGLSQLVGAFMLLFDRTKLLGTAILIPILLNIIVVDYFFAISPGAMLSAVGYLLGLGLVIYWSRDKVIQVMQILLSTDQNTSNFKNKIINIGIAAGLATVFLFLQTGIISLVGRLFL